MAPNNQLTSYSKSGSLSSREQYAIASGVHQVVKQVMNGAPLEVQQTKKGYIFNRAKICSVCTTNVSKDENYYYCSMCNHEICRSCYGRDRGCDIKKGHSSYVYKI